MEPFSGHGKVQKNQQKRVRILEWKSEEENWKGLPEPVPIRAFCLSVCLSIGRAKQEDNKTEKEAKYPQIMAAER